MSAGFSITTREVDNVTVLDMAGRLSFPDPHLQKKLLKLINEKHRFFVFNLSEVTYIDSYGLQDIVNAYKLVVYNSGKITILRPVPHVRKLLNMAFKSLFEVFDDEAAAVEAARKHEE